jgi:GNAT superfamily N-acetyltransferase
MTSPVHSTSATQRSSGARLRGVTVDDVGGVMALFRRHAWPLRSRAGWVWALFDSPARRATGADAGWVLESDGSIVGFLGNVPARFHVDGRPVFGATCTSLLVDELHRGRSMALVRAFTAQPGFAWVYSATANANSGPVYKAFAYRPCEQRQADTRLRWVTSKRAVLRSALERFHLGAMLPMPDVRPDTPADPVCGRSLFASRVLHPALAANDTAIRAAWDLFAHTLATQPGVQSDRSAATMAWRLADPDIDPDHLALWALREPSGRMLGMAIARRLPRQHGKPSKAELMDLAVLPECGPADVLILLRTCQAWAKSRGVAVLDAKRWTGAMATLLAQWGARVEPLPGDALWLRTGSGCVSAEGIDWPAWSMTGNDSDDWFNTMRTCLPDEPVTRVMNSAQAESASSNAWTKSEVVSTSEGSKRSMSTV